MWAQALRPEVSQSVGQLRLAIIPCLKLQFIGRLIDETRCSNLVPNYENVTINPLIL